MKTAQWVQENLKFSIVSGFCSVRSHIRVNINLEQRSSKAACYVQIKSQAAVCDAICDCLTQQHGTSSG